MVLRIEEAGKASASALFPSLIVCSRPPAADHSLRLC